MKKQREILTPKFTKQQIEQIGKLVGVTAGSPSEVVSRIVMMWFKENHEYVKSITENQS